MKEIKFCLSGQKCKQLEVSFAVKMKTYAFITKYMSKFEIEYQPKENEPDYGIILSNIVNFQ